MNGERPNILMVVLDCARSDRWLGPDKTARTPTLDRLAAEGVCLSTTIVETAATTPAFAGLLTGTYSFRHGISSVGGYRLSADLPTLPELLKAAGYHTYAEVTGPLVGVARRATGPAAV
jgi:arylsulfatase A-like enzyme